MIPSRNTLTKTDSLEDGAGDAEVDKPCQTACPEQHRGEASHCHVLLTKGQHHARGGEHQTQGLREPLRRSCREPGAQLIFVFGY